MTDMVEAMAEAVCSARCDPGRPDPGKGLDEFIAKAALSVVLDRLRSPDEAMVRTVSGMSDLSVSYRDGEHWSAESDISEMRSVVRHIADHLAKDAGI